MAHYKAPDTVPYGEGRVPMGGGWVADDDDYCAQCSKEFKIEDGEVYVPVNCDKGNFCSEQCRALAMYASADFAMMKQMRRMFLACSILTYAQPVLDYMESWEVYPDFKPMQTDELSSCLSPDGGCVGVAGPEDDAEALLLPLAVRKQVWEALYDARRVWRGDVAVNERNREKCKEAGMDAAYWDVCIKQSQESLAATEAALKALEGLEKIG
jgi:hypothetical protein